MATARTTLIDTSTCRCARQLTFLLGRLPEQPKAATGRRWAALVGETRRWLNSAKPAPRERRPASVSETLPLAVSRFRAAANVFRTVALELEPTTLGFRTTVTDRCPVRVMVDRSLSPPGRPRGQAPLPAAFLAKHEPGGFLVITKVAHAHAHDSAHAHQIVEHDRQNRAVPLVHEPARRVQRRKEATSRKRAPLVVDVQRCIGREAIWNRTLGSSSAKIVALRLLELAGADLPLARHAFGFTRRSERTVRAAIRDLEERRMIATTNRDGSTSEYEFVGIPSSRGNTMALLARPMQSVALVLERAARVPVKLVISVHYR
jgi:hypothetical protein